MIGGHFISVIFFDWPAEKKDWGMTFFPPQQLSITHIHTIQVTTTYEIVDWSDVPESVRHHFRRRADLRAGVGVDSKKTTCMLYLQADHLFYEQMGSEEAAIDVMTRHVQRVNSIYKDIGECVGVEKCKWSRSPIISSL